MRIAFPYNKNPEDYEPTRITLAPEYIFLENIFSTLLEIDTQGSLVPGIATSFEWIGNEAVFGIRENLRTAGGHVISANDVLLSLKRLLILGGNTHGNFRDLVCRGKTLRRLTDHCEGMRVENSTLIISPEKKSPFLFRMLAAIDFAVIPEKSFDPVTLRITDFRNTSGPYYVSNNSGAGRITLTANKNHYHYSSRIPETVHLIPTDSNDSESSLKALKNGEVDVVTTTDRATPESVLQFYKDHSDQYQLHRTFDLRIVLLVFTERGRNFLSPAERRWIGRNAKEGFLSYFEKSLAFNPAHQFFPVIGEGGLTDNQLSYLNDPLLIEEPCTRIVGNMRAPLVRLALENELTAIFANFLPLVSFTDGQSPEFIDYSANPEKMPLFYIAGPDTGLKEDIALISYSLTAGFFKVAKSDRGEWLTTYATTEPKSERIELLTQLHFDSLLDPVIVPLAVAPYVALSTKEWKIGLSKLYANCPFWLFERNS